MESHNDHRLNRNVFYRLLLLGLHTAWVLLVTYAILRSYEGPGYQEELQQWVLVVVVDLPAAVMLLSAEQFVGEWLYSSTTSPRTSYVLWPAAAYLLLGGIQWWLIGWFIDRRKTKAA